MTIYGCTVAFFLVWGLVGSGLGWRQGLAVTVTAMLAYFVVHGVAGVLG